MLSLVMITAKRDYPYVSEVAERMGKERVQLFDPTIECLRSQTMHHFELVVIDALFETRKDYFNNLDLPFTVKHIPADPNRWHAKGLPGVSTQYNKGIIHSDGDALFFFNAGYIFRENFIERLWQTYLRGYFPVVWFLHDWGSDPPPDKKVVKSPVDYDVCGFNGEQVTPEFRYYDCFTKGNRDQQSVLVRWKWWYTLAVVSTEAMLELNGFNEQFDGDRTLMDCDLGSRLDMAGYSKYIAMFRDLFVVRLPETDFGFWSDKVGKDHVIIKCTLPLIWLSREREEIQANRQILSDEDIEWLKASCAGNCAIPDKCDPKQYGFVNRKADNWTEYFSYWRNNQRTFDLAEERQLRLDGKKYTEGVVFEP